MEQLDAERIQERSGLGVIRIIGVSLFLVVLYVLSTGPVFKIWGNRRVPASIEAFYKPLEFAHDRSPVAKRFFDWYLGDLWRLK